MRILRPIDPSALRPFGKLRVHKLRVHKLRVHKLGVHALARFRTLRQAQDAESSRGSVLMLSWSKHERAGPRVPPGVEA